MADPKGKVRKKMKSGERFYTDYRCTYDNRKDLPRIRVTEADIDQQVLAVFDKMQV